MRKYLFILCIVFVFFNISFSFADYQVKTIYFIPTDSRDRLLELDLTCMMKSIRDTYKDAMEKHGFHGKIYELETDNHGKVVVHKVRGDHNKQHYSGNDTYFTVESELKRKGYNNRNSIYVTIMADMALLKGGTAVGLAGAVPQGGFLNDQTYWAYCMIAELLVGDIESYIAHELAHCFGLSHLHNDAEYIMGGGDKLLFKEAQWLSKNHYFNTVRKHSTAPDISKVHPIKFSDEDSLVVTANISDNDGLFLVYGTVNSYTIGWDIFVGDIKESVLELKDINSDWLTTHNHIMFRMMDIDGNWKWHGPVKYDLPEKPPSKENPLSVVENLATIWAELKKR